MIAGPGRVSTTRTLEDAMARLHGHRYGVAVGCGSAGLVAALRAVGTGRGTSVIVGGFDWSAPAAATLAVGAEPLVAPLSLRAGGLWLDAASLPGIVRASTTAVVVTHLFGLPAPADDLAEVCANLGLALIEDTSHAVGGRRGGQPVGSHGQLAVCSMGAGKPVDAGEGGMVLTSDDELFERVVSLTQHPQRQLVEGAPVDHLVIPSRLHPAGATQALAHLESLPMRIVQRTTTATDLHRALVQDDRIEAVQPDDGDAATWHRVPVLLDGAGIAIEGVELNPPGLYDVALLLGQVNRPDPTIARMSVAQWRADLSAHRPPRASSESSHHRRPEEALSCR